MRSLSRWAPLQDFEHAEEDSNASFSGTYYKMDSRRLFRDPDDRIVGGVCSGIAAYFNVDTVWIRLAFALSALFAGSGLILYIILWIVIPRAVTRADRMTMKGEKLTLQGFKKNFEAELGSVRNNFSNFHQEARPLVYKTRDFIGDFFYHLGTFFGGAGKVLLKLLGGLLILICFGFIIAILFVFIAVTAFGSLHPFPGPPFSIIQEHYSTPIYISALLVAMIPLLAIIMTALKGIFNTGGVSRSTGSTALVIWICSIGVLTYYAAKIASQFKTGASFVQTAEIKPAAKNTYYIKLNDIKYFTAEDSARLNIKTLFNNAQVTDEDENRELHNVHLSIEKSDVSKPVLVQSFSARGYDYDDALFNARNTKYIFRQQDSVLTFDYKLRSSKDDLWHGEAVYLTLKIPLNARVVVDQEVDRISDVNVYSCNDLNKKDNNKIHSATFVMTDNGLQCKVDTLVTDTTVRKHLPGDTTKF